MAAKTARPGRTLIVFFAGLAVAYGLVALGGSWTPELGLDLQGGTRITLIAEGDPTAENLEQARTIIDQRVNGSGVSEAEVVSQGGNIIVVEIPGETRRDLVETVERQAQLRFRLVACIDDGVSPCGTGAVTADPVVPTPGEGVTVEPTVEPTVDPAAEPTGTANRAGVSYGEESPAPTDEASPSDQASPTDVPVEGESEGTEPIQPPEGGEGVADPLTWIDAPNQEAVDAYNAFQCPADGSPANVVDDPDKPLVTCGTGRFVGVKYLLSAAMIEGTELDDASAAIPQGSVKYVVTLDFNGSGTETFADISRALVGTEKQFAIVLDGQVLSAPTMEGLITDGNAQIDGDFTQESAQSLATSLKYGALPISFEDPSTETIGPSLAGDQLRAGLVAGALGLGLVMIYCLLYYRGLGIVVVALPAGRRRSDVRPGAAAQRDRRLHADPARHRRSDRRGRHHGGLVHRLLRADPRRDARGQVDASGGRDRLEAGQGHLAGRATSCRCWPPSVLYIFATGVVQGLRASRSASPPSSTSRSSSGSPSRWSPGSAGSRSSTAATASPA